jgi:hypothetical protein
MKVFAYGTIHTVLSEGVLSDNIKKQLIWLFYEIWYYFVVSDNMR